MRKYCGGNATIEYVLFLPIFIIVLLLIIFFGLQMVRTSNMQHIVDETAQALARIWMTDDTAEMAELLKDGSFGSSSITKRERYWWFNSVFVSGVKLREAERQLAVRLSNQAIFQGNQLPSTKDFVVNVQYDPVFGGGEISITVQWHGSMLFGNLLKQFGLQTASQISVHASAHVADPREFINNTDYVLQTLQKTKFGNLLSVKMIEPIRNSITKFLKN